MAAGLIFNPDIKIELTGNVTSNDSETSGMELLVNEQGDTLKVEVKLISDYFLTSTILIYS